METNLITSTTSSKELRQKYLDFYRSKQHAILPSAPLVPKEDPTVLFNTAGMQPIVPYLLGVSQSPLGNRLANSQKCIRTDDIEEVGDNRHGTFFEMLGNWGIAGSYFKEEIIPWSMEFLTSPKWLGLDPERIFVTVYQGNGADVEVDNQAIELWQKEFLKLGIKAQVASENDYLETNKFAKIRTLSGKDNWWGLPYRGPCGPCSEMYYLMSNNPIDFEESILPNLSNQEKALFVDEQIVEIGNNVFMEYMGEWGDNKEPINLAKMEKPNIDTGLGFERFLAVINGVDTIYKTDLFEPILAVVDKFKTR
jgi:alanyl-tRNA synthetase